MSRHFIALLFHIVESFGVGLIETLIRSHMLHTKCFCHGRHTLELYYTAISSHLLNLLAILDINVCRTVLFTVLYGKAISWRWALATKALHLGTNLIYTQYTQCAIIRYDFTMTCHDNFRQRLNTKFFHYFNLFVNFHPFE